MSDTAKTFKFNGNPSQASKYLDEDEVTLISNEGRAVTGNPFPLFGNQGAA
jgi:hypothetical protein